MARTYYVYILSNRPRTVLYTGVTNSIRRRLAEHRAGTGSRFAWRYCCDALVYLETHRYILNAIAREQQIKRWRRAKKLALIRTIKPTLRDLSDELL